MKQTGVVVGIDTGKVVVSVKRDAACGKCKACYGSSEQDLLINVPEYANAKLGDKVAISMESAMVLRAALIMYCIPLAGLIGGVVAGVSFASQLGIDNEIAGVIGGVFFTSLAFIGIKCFEPYFKKMACFEPKIVNSVEKIKEGEQNDGS